MAIRNLSARRLTFVGAAIAVSLGTGIGIVVSTKDYSDAITTLRRDAGDNGSGVQKISDLLTGPVDAGQQITTEIALPIGARVQRVAMIGPSLGAFSTVESSHDDRQEFTLYTITVRNNSRTRLRLTAIIEYE